MPLCQFNPVCPMQHKWDSCQHEINNSLYTIDAMATLFSTLAFRFQNSGFHYVMIKVSHLTFFIVLRLGVWLDNVRCSHALFCYQVVLSPCQTKYSGIGQLRIDERLRWFNFVARLLLGRYEFICRPCHFVQKHRKNCECCPVSLLIVM